MKIKKQEILARIESLSRTRRILVQILILGLICGLFWFFYLDPARDQIAGLERDIQSLDIDIARFSSQAARLPELEKELGSREKELILAKTLLPEDAHALERLLASFERLGNEKGVRFLLFQPGTQELHQFYATRNVQLRLQGQFHDLISYFDELTRLDRLVSLQSLRLTPVAAQQRTDENVLSAETVLLVYRSLSPAELEARQ
ncbi:type 4a pilus biogenesis protein PilO [Desulfonatronovibrio hydrogenovorans]|uniref:type 4a pilus biogenesis protein PilO n=1 Tax=Desulfonatronovibrio hydrogenovorans TaxID=53245 RepID=UPI00048ACAC3|nr:type 4a pilus biogenesis protein PilO [Desulfonatronovibrio hydrogenovorans]